jgi:hypothetical protein
MADFSPSFDRPCPLTATAQATPGHPVHDDWQARIEADRAALIGPPTPIEAHNRAQLAILERYLFGCIRTPELR